MKANFATFASKQGVSARIESPVTKCHQVAPAFDSDPAYLLHVKTIGILLMPRIPRPTHWYSVRYDKSSRWKGPVAPYCPSMSNNHSKAAAAICGVSCESWYNWPEAQGLG